MPRSVNKTQSNWCKTSMEHQNYRYVCDVSAAPPLPGPPLSSPVPELVSAGPDCISRTRLCFVSNYRDSIAFNFVCRDSIAFQFFMQGVLCKFWTHRLFSTHTTHQTISQSSFFEHTRPTKHTTKSQPSLARVSLVEDR
jgi:hypothetical protein